MKKMPAGWIEPAAYGVMHARLAIPCVDVAIVRRGKILLVRRRREPVRGRYWFPGGRILKGETLLEAISRILSTEVGLSVRRGPYFAGFGNLRLSGDPFGHGQGSHTLCLAFSVEPGLGRPRIDRNHDRYRWSRLAKLPRDPYLSRISEAALAQIAGDGYPLSSEIWSNFQAVTI